MFDSWLGRDELRIVVAQFFVFALSLTLFFAIDDSMLM